MAKLIDPRFPADHIRNRTDKQLEAETKAKAEAEAVAEADPKE